MKKLSILVLGIAMAIGSTATWAQDDAGAGATACENVRFGMVDWPAVSIKTALAQWMLQKLGYQSSIKSASVPIVEQAMAQGDLDVFLAQWMPSQRGLFKKFGKKGSIDIVGANLQGGEYTLAVPTYVYDAGVHSIKDLAAHATQFQSKIYGIDPGSGGNSTIKRMIKDDYANLGNWQLVASSTAAMIAEVKQHIRNKSWVVFLGWSPHPMNLTLDMKYLVGGASYWGPNKGQVTVNTLTRRGYAWQCPNVGQFLQNYTWTPKKQSLIMKWAMKDGLSDLAAGKRIVRENPKMLKLWFGRSGNYETGGVKTADGKTPAQDVIRKALGIK